MEVFGTPEFCDLKGLILYVIWNENMVILFLAESVMSRRSPCAAVPQSQQLSRLLHLAASHGMSTVASFLLHQPGAKEALRRSNSHGQTPACVAHSKGHKQLVELFTR